MAKEFSSEIKDFKHRSRKEHTLLLIQIKIRLERWGGKLKLVQKGIKY
jgi:hypothetical protein